MMNAAAMRPACSTPPLARAARIKGHVDENKLRRNLETLSGWHRVNFQAEQCKWTTGQALDDYLVHLAQAGTGIRLRLLRLGASDQIVMLTADSGMLDLRSAGQVFEELIRLNSSGDLTSPSREAQDELVCRQAEFLSSPAAHAQLCYWRDRLPARMPVLTLPTAFSRSARAARMGMSHAIDMRYAENGLAGFCRKHGVPLDVLLFTAAGVLLHCYSGDPDLIFGVPVTVDDWPGSSRRNSSTALGNWLNTVLVRLDWSGDPEFAALLGVSSQSLSGALAHKHLPLDRVATELDWISQDGGSLFRASFTSDRLVASDVEDSLWSDLVLGEDGTEREIDGLVVCPLALPRRHPRSDIEFIVANSGARPRMWLVMKDALFPAGTGAWLAGLLQKLLLLIGEQADRRLSDLRALLVPPLVRSFDPAVLHPAASSFVEFRREEVNDSIPARFVRQANRFEERIAIAGDLDITYGRVLRSAQGVAETLRHAMGETQRPVGLLFDHGAAALITIMGALLANKCYVPIDPRYPSERQLHMLRSSKAAAIVSDGANATLGANLAAALGVVPIQLDPLDKISSIDATAPQTSPDSLAYVLYTSGSTGQPKGVAQTHRNVLFQVRNQTNNLRLCPEDRLSLLSSLSFDASVTDLFCGLLNGATVVPIDIRRTGLAAARQQLREHQVNIYHSTPTVFRSLFAGLSEGELNRSVRAIVLGGEKVTQGDFHLFCSHFAENCILVNGYGATEASFAIQNHLRKDSAPQGEVLAVGHPIDGVEIVLFDQAGRETLVQGEIGIRCHYLAPGYLDMPDLTAAAFVRPTSRDSAPIYRTGDIGLQLPDGKIFCAGRKDGQVKIRGHRVESAEIEASLRAMPEVVNAVVVAVRDDVSEDLSMVAFIVPKQAGSADTVALRRKLAAQLPDFMMPSLFVLVEQLPKTDTHKIDTGALRRLAERQRRAAAPATPPQSSVEVQIAEVWRLVLQVEAVDRDESFFEAGGSSLSMLRLNELLREKLGIEMPLVRMFQFPTIASMARYLADKKTHPGSLEQVADRMGKRRGARIRREQRNWMR